MGSCETPSRKPWIETPLIESAALSKAAGCHQGPLSLGIGNLILSHLNDPSNQGKKLHFYSSSGGNAGLAAVTAARDLGAPCTVVVPTITSQMMIDKLLAAGASDVLQKGANWFEADTYMRQRFLSEPGQTNGASVDGASSSSTPVRPENGKVENGEEVRNIYISPFNHPEIWNGASTLVSELAHQLPPREQPPSTTQEHPPASFPADAIVCSVGGGGLFNGIVQGLGDYHSKATKFTNTTTRSTPKNTQVLAVETAGADSLSYSLQKGSLQRLPSMTSLATSLGATLVAEKTYQNAISPPPGVDVSSIVLSDACAAQGVISLLDETRLLVELASAVCVNVAVGKGDGGKTPLKEVVKDFGPESRVVIVVCGGSNVTAEQVVEWRRRLAEGWE
ncbi:hypothetical protein FQN54_008896 [Arachnomyces sp. PD_36]|nr:hypothetical protein FQN54_008896 [Arachnomyces sp. PD_36]